MREFSMDPRNPDPEMMALSVEVLVGGGLVAFPTDTLYGLTCDPRRRESLLALHRLKQRPLTRSLPFIASDVAQAGLLVSLEGEATLRLIDRFWPGPLTLVLPLTGIPRLASWNWGPTLAIRVPDAPVARELARGAGIPLPATSANLSGQPPSSDARLIGEPIRRKLDLVLDVGRLSESLPSTILDLSRPLPRLIRPGAIPAIELAECLGVKIDSEPD